MRKYKRFIFDDRKIYTDGLVKDDLIMFFNKLPKNAKIIQWGHLQHQASSFFIVEHESFAAVNEWEQLPEEHFSFDKPIFEDFKNKTQEVYYNTVISSDFATEINNESSNAIQIMTTLELQEQNSKEECDCGAEKHGFLSHVTGCPKYES